jgi:hypothetical protein
MIPGVNDLPDCPTKACTVKLFYAVISCFTIYSGKYYYSIAYWAFVTASHFYPSLIFTGETKAYMSLANMGTLLAPISLVLG